MSVARLATTFTPAAGEGPISAGLQRAIDATLALVPPDKTGAFVTAVQVEAGKTTITVAAAVRTKGGWQAGVWARSDVQDKLDAGVFVKKTW